MNKLSIIILVLVPTLALGRCGFGMSSECAAFYAMPATDRRVMIKTYPLERQFELYKCGMRREPPDLGIALEIADNGEKAIPFLNDQLSKAKDEPTQSHIIYVFETMSRRGYLRNRRDIVEKIRSVVAGMKSTVFKDMGLRSLENIDKELRE